MRRRVLVLVVVAAAFGTPAALATWSSSVSTGPMTVSTATLADPTNLTAANNSGVCIKNTPSSLEVDLTWTATTSPRATGYTILRNGTQVGTASPASATGWSDTTGKLAFSTSYTYTVESTVGGWTSPGATVSITTFSKLCR